ncbi:hypothetical protein KF840_22330 [bacterium]|nr:hypothetical protein [bacterium]
MFAAAVLLAGCIPRVHPSAAPDPTLPSETERFTEEDGADDNAAADARRVAPQRPLTPAERQVQELEAQLAERDRTIAAVQTQLAAARRQPSGSPVPTEQTGGGSTTGSSAPLAGGVTAPDSSAAALAAKEAELDEAKRQVATLETRLDSEMQRRKHVESEMAKLLEETSAGPYERSGNVVDQHLREQLATAQQEIGELRNTLATERRERGDLERRYATLQQQLERTARSGADSEEIAALKERQRRVLASIQQDLAASQQREGELRAALAQQDGDGVSLADSVTSLRAENAALQRRLDDEHRQNRELASKLKLAGRVTDLIFKMQSSGTTTAASMPQ